MLVIRYARRIVVLTIIIIIIIAVSPLVVNGVLAPIVSLLIMSARRRATSGETQETFVFRLFLQLPLTRHLLKKNLDSRRISGAISVGCKDAVVLEVQRLWVATS